MVAATRPQRAYDHRLREFVHRSGSDRHAVRIAIPRSTLHSWKSRAPKPVVGLIGSDKSINELEAEVVRLTLQVRKLRCILRLLLVLVKLSGFRLESLRLPKGRNKQRLLREVGSGSCMPDLSVAQSAGHDSALAEPLSCMVKKVRMWIDRHAVVSQIQSESIDVE